MSGKDEHPGRRKCDECSKRRATVELTEFRDGKPFVRHLCEECYNKQEGVPPLATSKILGQLVAALAPELQELSVKVCPQCGMNYLKFRQTLRMGCPNDYEVFAPALDQFLKQLHGANRHVGKVPRGAAQRASRVQGLEVLRRELDEAVAAEHYERAAQLQDEIKELEREVAGPSQT